MILLPLISTLAGGATALGDSTGMAGVVDTMFGTNVLLFPASTSATSELDGPATAELSLDFFRRR